MKNRFILLSGFCLLLLCINSCKQKKNHPDKTDSDQQTELTDTAISIKGIDTLSFALYENEKKYLYNQMDFQNTIIQLRALKYARILYKKLLDKHINIIRSIKVEKSSMPLLKKNSVDSYQYVILLSKIDEQGEIDDIVSKFISKAPLSKFGIEAHFVYTDNMDDIIKEDSPLYSSKITHRFIRKIKTNDNLGENEKIISPIRLSIDENEFKEL